MITGSQIREARALLRWSVPRLSARTKVPEHMLAQAEQVDDTSALTLDQIVAIKMEMERAGIEFLNCGQPSVRLWKVPEA